METNIVTRFTIGNEGGVNALLFLTAAIAREKFSGKVPDTILEEYIKANFNKEALLTELNSLSNQFLVVYADEEPSGYARVTSKGDRPKLFEGKTLARIADFGVLDNYKDLSINKSLFEKCLLISNKQQVVWINEFEASPYLEFFESYGFKKNEDVIASYDLSLPSVVLVKEYQIN